MLGCLGVVNECLARAEVETMASPVLKERATAGDKLIAASFPLLGELALALHPSPPLHGKLFVFLRKSTLMDLLPLLARHLERALTVGSLLTVFQFSVIRNVIFIYFPGLLRDDFHRSQPGGAVPMHSQRGSVFHHGSLSGRERREPSGHR